MLKLLCRWPCCTFCLELLPSLLLGVPTLDFRALLNVTHPSPSQIWSLPKDGTFLLPLFISLYSIVSLWVGHVSTSSSFTPPSCNEPYPAMSSWKTPRTWVSLTYGGKETVWHVNLWSLIPGTWNLFKTVLFALSNYSEMINYHWLMGVWVILFSLHLTATYFYNYKCYTTLKCFSIT